MSSKRTADITGRGRSFVVWSCGRNGFTGILEHWSCRPQLSFIKLFINYSFLFLAYQSFILNHTYRLNPFTDQTRPGNGNNLSTIQPVVCTVDPGFVVFYLCYSTFRLLSHLERVDLEFWRCVSVFMMVRTPLLLLVLALLGEHCIEIFLPHLLGEQNYLDENEAKIEY